MAICKKCGGNLDLQYMRCDDCGESPSPGEVIPVSANFIERSHFSLTMGEEKPVKKRYKITIEEQQLEETLTSGAWQVVDQRDGDSKYGNPKQVPQMENVNRTIFTQDVDELDLVGVIKAINKIE